MNEKVRHFFMFELHVLCFYECVCAHLVYVCVCVCVFAVYGQKVRGKQRGTRQL